MILKDDLSPKYENILVRTMELALKVSGSSSGLTKMSTRLSVRRASFT